MARAKSPAYKRSLAAQKATRFAKELRKQAKKIDNDYDRANAMQQAAHIESLVKQTKIGRSKDAAKIQQAEDAAQRLNAYQLGMQSRNRAFGAKMREGRITSDEMMSDMQTDLFYAATKRIWKGKRIEDRNFAIMEHYGASNLESAFKAVMKENSAAVKRLQELKENGWVDENGKPIDSDLINQLAELAKQGTN